MRPARIAVAFATALVAAAPAVANEFGPRVAVGGVYHQTSDVTSTDGAHQNGGHCTNVHGCFVLFQRAPNNQEVIIEHVSCRLAASAPNLTGVFLLSRLNGNFVFEQSTLIPVKVTASSSLWNVSGNVLHPLHADEIPLVQIDGDTSGNIAGVCSISGHVVTP